MKQLLVQVIYLQSSEGVPYKTHRMKSNPYSVNQQSRKQRCCCLLVLAFSEVCDVRAAGRLHVEEKPKVIFSTDRGQPNPHLALRPTYVQ
jgi:hypothetical protein